MVYWVFSQDQVLTNQLESTMPHSPVSPYARSPFHILAKPAGPICNLDCEYCFYLRKEKYFENSKFKMTDEMLELFISQYIAAQPLGTPEVNFGWQGGEPTLMGVGFFKRAVELQKKYAREGMTVSNGFQTNGTLLDDEWGEFLHENEFLIGVSIDGPRDHHNKYRLDKRGGGSFDAVSAGIEVLKRHKVEFNTLTVVQDNNGDHPKEIYDFLKSIGSTFFQFIPIVEFEHGTVGQRSVAPKQWGTFLNGIFDHWLAAEDVGKIFIQAFDNTLAQVMGQTYGLCVHSPTCGNALALEHNGDLFSCDHYVTPANKLGNISETPLIELVTSAKQQAFGAHKETGLTEQCKSCDVLRYCRGACPKDRVANSNNGEAGQAQLCEGYYAFYKHAVPVLEKMGVCLKNQQPASRCREVADPADPSKPSPALKDTLTGRNDPCPCGSGKKYKKCCGK